MFRKLLILSATSALFTAVTVIPASAIAVEVGPDGDAVSVIVPQFSPDGNGPNNAHGPGCGTADAGTPDGCLNHTAPDAAIDATSNVPGLNIGINLGAWNSVFQSNADNSAICGIWATVEEAEAGFEFLACDYVAP